MVTDAWDDALALAEAEAETEAEAEAELWARIADDWASAESGRRRRARRREGLASISTGGKSEGSKDEAKVEVEGEVRRAEVDEGPGAGDSSLRSMPRRPQGSLVSLR